MGEKKWYNYFVSVDPSQEEGQPEPAPTSAAAQIEALARSAGAKPSSTAAQKPPPGSRPRSVAEIAAQMAEPKMPAAAGVPVSFQEIYKLANIGTPTHGYTILKVAEMLQSEHIRGLSLEVKRSSILVALEAAGVKLDEVIQDAVGRDRALDAYERAQQKSLEDLEARKAAENRQIQAELDRLVAEHQARIQANADEVAREKERMYGWCLKKQEEEQKIADAVGHFLSENPITTSAPRPARPPAPGNKDNKEK